MTFLAKLGLHQRFRLQIRTFNRVSQVSELDCTGHGGGFACRLPSEILA